MRIESARPCRCGGWLHELDGTARQHLIALPQPRRERRNVRELDQLFRGWVRNVIHRGDLVEELADRLGLHPVYLQSFGLGWTGREWSFPMFDARLRCIGIRLRRPRLGQPDAKYSVRGGREGLFVPYVVPSGGELFLAEGPTDACAIQQLGCDAIGRPSCRGGEDIAIEFARGRDVVVVADRDRPGIEGAEHLAHRLLPYAARVRLLVPPEPYKDVREWLTDTWMSREQLLAHVDRLPVRRPGVQLP